MTGGRVPNIDWFKCAAGGRKIFCVDRGVELCRACDIVPNFLIGDFDSAATSAVAWARTKNFPVEVYPADKDLTDTQLALQRADEIFDEHVALLTGCFGGRLDHLYNTLFTCAAVDKKIFLADEREIVLFVKGGQSVAVKFFSKPFAVSLLPMTDTCTGVTTKNLRWELNGATLTQKFPNATSNRLISTVSDDLVVEVERGTLAVYFCFDETTLAAVF